MLDRPIPVSGHVTDARTGAPLTASLELLNVTFSNGEANASGGAYGAYHFFLPPGTYDIRFSAPGYAPAINRVTVTATSATVVDVQLTPLASRAGAPRTFALLDRQGTALGSRLWALAKSSNVLSKVCLSLKPRA